MTTSSFSHGKIVVDKTSHKEGIMKKNLPKLAIALSILSISSIALASNFLNQDTTVPALNKASAAYLAGDFKKMTVEIKNVFLAQPNDPLIKENAFELLNKAYQVSGERGIETDWHLPSEITNMKISVRRDQNDVPKYALTIYGNLTASGMIKQLRVTHFPDQVIMDKLAGIGDFSDEEDAKTPGFFYVGNNNHEPIPTGLYLLRVELINGKVVDGWFLIDEDMNATANPDVTAPAMGQVFQTGNPTFRWLNFQTPQYKPYETRSVWIGVSKVTSSDHNDQKWILHQNSPILQEATIGSTVDGIGVRKLDDGRYFFQIKYHERKRFGDVLIGRDAMTTRAFSVRQ